MGQIRKGRLPDNSSQESGNLGVVVQVLNPVVGLFYLVYSTVIPTTVLEIKNETLVRLRKDYEEMQRYFDAFIAYEMKSLHAHIAWIKHSHARRRIQDFRETYPVPDQILPEDDKAYYLGMSRRWYNLKK